MIIDSIKYAEYYSSLHPEFKAVFAALSQMTEQTAGRTEIDGEKAFINVSSYTNKPVEECKFESHKKYIDIQYIISGEERIDLADSSELVCCDDRLDEGDIAFFENTDKFDTALLTPGRYVVIFPGEAHRPCVAPDGKGVKVVKAVAKILL